MVFDQGLGDIYVVRRARRLQTYPTLAPQRCCGVRSRGRQRSAHGRCSVSALEACPQRLLSRLTPDSLERASARACVQEGRTGAAAQGGRQRGERLCPGQRRQLHTGAHHRSCRCANAKKHPWQASSVGRRRPCCLREGAPPAPIDRQLLPALLEQRPARRSPPPPPPRPPDPRPALTRARRAARAAAGRAPGGRAGPLALHDRRGRGAVLGAAPRPARAARGHCLAPGPEARAGARARAAPAQLGRRRARAQGARPRSAPILHDLLCGACARRDTCRRCAGAPVPAAAARAPGGTLCGLRRLRGAPRPHAERGPGALHGTPRPRACRDGCRAQDPLREPGTSAGPESAPPRAVTSWRRCADGRADAAQPVLGNGGRAGRDARPQRAARRAAARGRPAGPPVRLRAAGGRRRGRGRRRRGAARRARAAGDGLGVAGRLDARRGAAPRARIQPQRKHVQGNMKCA